MIKPPVIAAGDNGFPVNNQSVIATMKIVSIPATEDKTGEVREMSTRKDPENVAFARTEISNIHAASPRGHSNFSMPVK